MTAPGAAPPSAAPLRVAFLHLGRAKGGVPRYGRILAGAAAADAGLQATDVEAGGRSAGLGDLRRAALDCAAAEVVELQWKLADWGGGWRGLGRLAWFLTFVGRPVVATLHDVYAPRRRRDHLVRPEAWALRLLGLRARRLVVHADEERRRLRGATPAAKLAVVPHFVEGRPALPGPEDARRELGLERRRVVTLLGYITERKGHRLLLEALPGLAPDVSVVIAGAPIAGRDFRRRELETLAEALTVADRVVFTGYVGDEMLGRVLAATDVGVCPFTDVSASGSLSTWISAGTRIVASDLPAIREYDALEPGAIRRFAPRTPETLAQALTAALQDAATSPGPDPHVERLAEALALPRTISRYADVWREAATVP